MISQFIPRLSQTLPPRADTENEQPSFSLDGRLEALLPKEISARMAHEQTFRITHRNGSVIVMAKSETDKALWLSSLEHQMKLRKTTQIGTVTSGNRIVHEVRACACVRACVCVRA